MRFQTYFHLHHFISIPPMPVDSCSGPCSSWSFSRAQSGRWLDVYKRQDIGKVNPISIQMWLTSLCIQRLEQKTDQVQNLVTEYNGSWEEAFYVSLARSFGLKINSLPFELLAKSTPLKALSKVKDNLISVEALLFGQAGLLNFSAITADDYMQELVKEYNYQQRKFCLLYTSSQTDNPRLKSIGLIQPYPSRPNPRLFMASPMRM